MNASGIRSIALILAVSLTFLVWSQTCSLVLAQHSTKDRLPATGFWPTQSAAPRSDYTGPAACSSCHAAIFDSQIVSPMATTAMRAKDASILRSHAKMDFNIGSYHYEIKTDAKEPRYLVSDGLQTSTAVLSWAFGSGHVGQSYLFQKADGGFYEARVSFFDSLNALQFTPGRALNSPQGLEEAIGRPVGHAEVAGCFSCHATVLFNGRIFDEKNIYLGVSCEACHGPGKKHIAKMQAAKIVGTEGLGETDIFSTDRLSPSDALDFCGACHGSYWDVTLAGKHGVGTSRFQPFRLQQSKCWGKNGDVRLTCAGCHDPHKKLETDPESYDKNCLACHAASPDGKDAPNRPGRNCPVSSKNCVSCHMPNIYIPEMLRSFPDHRIRIVRAGDAYPE